MNAELVVSEVFGPTIQGEGPSAGQRAGFVRLGRCNLACTWCDTPYTWDWSRFDPAVELRRVQVGDVADAVAGMGVDLVVVTGGEPLLQQAGLVDLLDRLPGCRVEVETAGTITPSPELVARVERFNVSPKLAGSGNPEDRRLRPEALAAFAATGKAVFKFVVAGAPELDEVAAVAGRFGLSPVWVMPEGTDAATVQRRLAELAEPVVARGWNLSPRLHVTVWGDRRGV